MPTTRTRVLDAAIDLLGGQGLRALTHGRVDEAAGVPPGSTSNYFRTRSALLVGTAERVIELEMPGVTAGLEPTTPEDLVDGLCALLDRTTGPQRTLTAARLVLFLEASHHRALRDILDGGRAQMEAVVVTTLGRAGARDPGVAARALMACLEGLILHRITRDDRGDVRPTVEAVVRGLLA
ncbi:TetR/AcrR family transcriptional regulator [Georgenia alba]|uniref:TetR/AcrR family transcriptional regulator n=1 Tax=Georgenia alba TaxID=2233858 RepID=A0ABW2Q3E1_9MICO